MKKNEYICPCCSTVRVKREMKLNGNCYECGCGYAIIVSEKGE